MVWTAEAGLQEARTTEDYRLYSSIHALLDANIT